MSKEVAKAQSTELTVENDLGHWGKSEVSSNDIVIPKIQLMQGMSQAVVGGKNKLGDMIDSVTGELLGNTDKPMEVVPFHLEKFFVVQKHNGKKWMYERIEKINPQNENAPYDFEENGQRMKRVYTRRFYVLVSGNVLPYTIDFASTSAKAGKELATEMFVKNAMMKLPPAASKIAIGSKLEKNDDGTYAVKTIKVVGKSSNEEIKSAFEWYKTISKKDVVVAGDDF
jgi:hypothetical protein